MSGLDFGDEQVAAKEPYQAFAEGFIAWYTEHYNHTNDTTKYDLQVIYTQNSLLTIQDQVIVGTESIINKLTDSNLIYSTKTITHYTAQPSIGETVLICMQGEMLMTPEEEHTIPYMEIVLVGADPETEQFYIINQIFSTHSL